MSDDRFLAPVAAPGADLTALAQELTAERQRRRLDRMERRARAPQIHQPVASVPSVDSQLYANMGRYAGNVVMAVFEEIGGVAAMADWAEENPGEFYTKLYTKVITAPKQVEVNATMTLEEAVKALDMQEGVDYTVVSTDPTNPSQF